MPQLWSADWFRLSRQEFGFTLPTFQSTKISMSGGNNIVFEEQCRVSNFNSWLGMLNLYFSIKGVLLLKAHGLCIAKMHIVIQRNTVIESKLQKLLKV
jgi:hypothetical protein